MQRIDAVQSPIAQTAGERSRFSRGLVALILWIALNAADALITWYSFGHGAEEANPVLLSWLGALGPGPMLISKMLIATLAGVGVWWWGKHRVLRIINVAMIAVVAYNLSVVLFILP